MHCEDKIPLQFRHDVKHGTHLLVVELAKKPVGHVALQVVPWRKEPLPQDVQLDAVGPEQEAQVRSHGRHDVKLVGVGLPQSPARYCALAHCCAVVHGEHDVNEVGEHVPVRN